MGAGPLLCVASVVLETDATQARQIARGFLKRLPWGCRNYTNNFLRLGFNGRKIARIAGSKQSIDRWSLRS